ncbi:MAG: SGNH/GDSL hydrolase family protein [Aeromicrobium erythreum]
MSDDAHEPTPAALPLRVLVKGASTVGWTSMMGGPRNDFIVPRVIESALLERGRPCQVQTYTMASEPTSTILGTWQREVVGFSPDAIVMIYGHYETIHLFLPRWLEIHANSLRGRPRRLALLYRRKILRPFWSTLAKLQAAIDVRLEPTRLRPGRPRRVADDLETYIGHVRKVASPLVVLVELLPPASRFVSWFPGMPRRIEVMNEHVRGLVERLDSPDVRYVRVRDLVDTYFDGDLDRATPDGFHYAPELHDLVGRRVASVVDEWARTKTHLVTGGNTSILPPGGATDL